MQFDSYKLRETKFNYFKNKKNYLTGQRDRYFFSTHLSFLSDGSANRLNAC